MAQFVHYINFFPEWLNADFNPAYADTARHEGGYVPVEVARGRGDSGGETYAGVSRNNNPDWAGWKIIDAYKAKNGVPGLNAHIQDARLDGLVREVAKEKYWDAVRGDEIANQQVANLIFDIYYMSGGFGAKQVQKALNKISPANMQVKEDGVIGNATLTHLNAANQSQLYDALYTIRKEWIEVKGKEGNVNATGWLNRLKKFPSEIAEQAKEFAKHPVASARRNPGKVAIGVILITVFVSLGIWGVSEVLSPKKK